jgi:hypothetical protein
MPGAELVPGKGTATPQPATLEERRIRLWASPHGAPKAAIAGAAGMPASESFGENPAVLLDNQAKAGARSTTTLEWQGEKAVLTFPIPDVPGAMATATLSTTCLARRRDAWGQQESSSTASGRTEQPAVQDRCAYAGTMVERKNARMRSVNAKVTEIGQITSSCSCRLGPEGGWKVRLQ